MTKFTCLSTALLAIVVSQPSNAQNTPEQTPYSITVFSGLRAGGDFDHHTNGSQSSLNLDDASTLGLTIAWPFDDKRQGELLFSHAKTQFESTSVQSLNQQDIAISYLHLGGNVPLHNVNLPFYLTGGIGVTHLSPDLSQLSSETHFSANLGLMSKIALSPRVDFTLGARVYGTFIDADSELFCNDEQCGIKVDSDVWFQHEVSIGLRYSF